MTDRIHKISLDVRSNSVSFADDDFYVAVTNTPRITLGIHKIKREGADDHTIRMPNSDCQSRREGEELVFIWFGGEGRLLQIMDLELWVELEKFRKR